jgi:hypothetical protein
MAGKRALSMRVKGVDDSPLPDSKNFGDPESTRGLLTGLEGLHVNGEPIEEWAEHMPEEIVRRMSYPLTDEGQDEQARIASDRSMRGNLGRPMTDAEDRKLKQYQADRRGGMEPWEASHPLNDVAARHVGPGMRPKFLSDKRVTKEGGHTRGFEVVKHNGDPVRVGGLVLAQMPEEMAQRRNTHFAAKSKDLVKQVYDRASNDRIERATEMAKSLRPASE